ncbi:hypothetical protein GFC01_05180 [Desulfofundulus thermobenzoicus]|uniref:Uncharacterized protein n=1 Tax=Desulfofundulus thermobenzoicus TaxID=29376 RepID=A0A6N7INS8_9FIRM|nr:NfeD family protein [Desulfofundulus thermobenzoicus]MQL51662.1 hypothetical protein [Desulfofundulus thermobenzoicus]HHW43216.1 hypothetical protein [Desulfotomaculum sp.]
MSQQLLTWLAVLAFLLGMVALVLEIFVIPGFGVAGMAGLILLAWGVLLLAVDFTQATAALGVAVILSVVVFYLGLKFMARFNLWQRVTLGTRLEKDEGYVAGQVDLVHLVDLTGVALTPLRPAGTAEVAGRRLDVITGGEYIPAGTRVQVVQVEGNRVIVKRADEAM